MRKLLRTKENTFILITFGWHDGCISLKETTMYRHILLYFVPCSFLGLALLADLEYTNSKEKTIKIRETIEYSREKLGEKQFSTKQSNNSGNSHPKQFYDSMNSTSVSAVNLFRPLVLPFPFLLNCSNYI